MGTDTPVSPALPDPLEALRRDVWNRRGIGSRARALYARDAIVRAADGLRRGEDALTAAALAALVDFPDSLHMGEDLVWCGTEETGFYAAQRILTEATHAGNGPFGPATGAPVLFRMMVDAHVTGGVVAEEWVVRDSGAILRQTGQDPLGWATHRAEHGARAFVPADDVPGAYRGAGNDSEWGAALAAILLRMMESEFSVARDQYDSACHLEYPGGRTAHGHAAADAFWLPLRAAFPSATFRIHHQIGRADAGLSPRAAVRWSLTGRHDGWGHFGAPSGAEVYVMGITHAEFGPWGLRRDYTLIDEAAVWLQIAAHLG